MSLRNKIVKLFEAHDLFDIQGSVRNPNMWHSYPSTDYAMLENDEIPRIYCDMDGVIADFNAGFINRVNKNPDAFEMEYGQDAFWDLIESWGETFWEELPWMPDGKELWNYLSKYNPIILSAAMPTYQRKGKAKWLQREVGYADPYVTNPSQWKGQSNIIFHKDKYQFILKKNEILIDDTPKKINDWTKSEGMGILHTSAKSTIRHLKKIGL